jgi:hypothetical protein
MERTRAFQETGTFYEAPNCSNRPCHHQLRLPAIKNIPLREGFCRLDDVEQLRAHSKPEQSGELRQALGTRQSSVISAQFVRLKVIC